jgi:exopolysaccharide biosynthesis polyprenyl glycosylphosphotransferase
LPRIGAIDELESVCADFGVERIIVGPTVAQGPLIDLIRRTQGLDVSISLVPTTVDVLGPSVEIDDLEGVTVLGINPPSLTRSSRMLKRTMDVLIASTVAVVALPLMLLAALAVKITSPGPALFVQERVGRHGRRFKLYKLRTMTPDAEQRAAELRASSADPNWLLLDSDPRVTRVGSFLRHSSLDELPQLWNVLRGEMSLVGPRPLVRNEDDHVLGRHRARLDITPGLTGPWQVMGRTEIPFSEMVKLDYLYVAEWSLWNDLKLLIRTAPVVLTGRGQ